MQKILESSVELIRASRTSVRTSGTLRMLLAKMERYESTAMSASSKDSEVCVCVYGSDKVGKGWRK